MPPLIRPPVPPLERRLREFWAHFDARDYEALLAMMTEDAMETDDLAQGWLRGQAAIGEHFVRIGQRSEDSHTLLEDVKVTETSATAVVTCLVHYQMRWDGQPASVKGADDDDLRPRGRSVEDRAAPHEVAERARHAGRHNSSRESSTHDDPCSVVAARCAVSWTRPRATVRGSR